MPGIKKNSKVHSVLVLLFLIAVSLLALNKIHDPDAWLILTHGKILWELNAVPGHEMFTFPNPDVPHLYTAWLFGLICYVAYIALGVYGLGLAKVIFVASAFIILLKDSLKPFGNLAVAVIVLTIVAFFAQDRFVLRPDIALMVLLPLSIFCLNAYLYEGKRYLYSLPLIHLLWSNCHSSIVLMFVPYLAFIVGGGIQILLSKRGVSTHHAPSPSQIKTVSFLLAVSFAASLLNPNFIGQYLYGFNILSMEWVKNWVAEYMPFPAHHMYGLYASYVAMAASFVLSGKRFSMIHLLLVVPFLLLPFMAGRFVMVAAIGSGPVFARNISAFLEAREWTNLFRGKPAIAIASLFCLVLIIAGQFGMSRYYKFGFGFDYSMMPRGPIRYMDRNDIQGKVLNTFHLGQYIIWTGYPGRKVFVDGRTNLREELLDKLILFRYKNRVLDDLYDAYGFDSILVSYDRPPADPVLRLLSHPQWALVYWDDSYLLYLRRGGRYDPVIKEDEYRHVIPQIHPDLFVKNLGTIENRMNMEAELKRNISETGSVRARTLTGLLYYSSGRYSEAIDVLRSLSSFEDHLILGDCYRQIGHIDEALEHYNEALKIGEDARAIYRVGAVYFAEGETEKALRYLERAVSMKPDMLEAYAPLADIYRARGENAQADKVRIQYYRQKSFQSALDDIKKGERDYNERRYDAALEYFIRASLIDFQNPILYNDLGYVYYGMGQLEKSYEYFSKALDLDPYPFDSAEGVRLPNAYYGLGLVYASKGDRQTATAYFKKYIGTRRSGYYSGYYARQAEKQIVELSQLVWNGMIPAERIP